MKYQTITLLTLLVSMGAWGDGPESYEPELAKKQISECSDGITQTWTYKSIGHIFHGKNLDLACVEKLDGTPSYDDEKDNFIFRDNSFWYFIDEESYGSSVIDTEYGVVVIHSLSTHKRNYLIKNIFEAKTQEDIFSKALRDGRIKLHEDFYISYGSKSYLTTQGGAFWSNVKLNYDNQILELLDIESGSSYEACSSPEELMKNSGHSPETIKEYIYPNGLSSWWLSALTYHKRPTWCFSYCVVLRAVQEGVQYPISSRKFGEQFASACRCA